MSLLKGLTSNTTDVEQEKDSVGGSFLVESGLYPCKVELAYLEKSQGGALALNVHLKSGDATIRDKLWVTSGDAKGNKNYYEKDGKKYFLPGFNVANALCLLTIGKELGELNTEEATIKLYNYDAKGEIPTKVDLLKDIMGEEIIAGIIKQTVDKNVKDATGNYVPSGQTRDENIIDKLFRASDNMTVTEIRAEETEATFIEKWKAKNEGVTRDRSSGVAASSTAGAPAAAAPKPANSLFAKTN